MQSVFQGKTEKIKVKKNRVSKKDDAKAHWFPQREDCEDLAEYLAGEVRVTARKLSKEINEAEGTYQHAQLKLFRSRPHMVYTDTHSHAHLFSVLTFQTHLDALRSHSALHGSKSNCQNLSIKSSLECNRNHIHDLDLFLTFFCVLTLHCLAE